MEHLTMEQLARLVDEAPTPEEREHLRRCAPCVEELDALRDQTEALGRLPALRPPAGDWEVLQARLVSEGLVKGRSPLGSRLARTPGWMKAAAAVLLFLAGTFTGGVASRGPLGTTLAGVTPALGIPAVSAAATPTSSEEAARRVRLLERQYMDALVQLRQLQEMEGEPGALPDPERRLAALEYMARAGQAALREAPADPFLNGILATTVAERDAVLRRISSGDDGNWF